MSVRVMAAVWAIDLPDSEKLVLLALADCANDEGGCWPSMATLAKKCSKSDRTVQTAIKALVDKQHLSRVEKPGKGVNYHVHPRSGCTPETVAPPKRVTQTPEAASDKPSRTIIPKKTKRPSLERARQKPAHRLPANWEPEPFAPGQVSFDIVAAWEPGRIERELAKFRDHWIASSGQKARKHDWQAAWRTWIGNADEFGSRSRQGTNGVGRSQPSDGLSATTRAAVAVFGPPGARHQ